MLLSIKYFEFPAKCINKFYRRVTNVHVRKFVNIRNCYTATTHFATSISFRCGARAVLSHNNCSAISALFLRSVGSTTYELLLATPDTEPVKK